MLKTPLYVADETCVDTLMHHGVLKCAKADKDVNHYKDFLQILSTKYFRPISTNYSASVSDKRDLKKIFFNKPLSRKSLKL